MIKPYATISSGVEDFEDWVNYWDASEKTRQTVEEAYQKSLNNRSLDLKIKKKRKRLVVEEVREIRRLKTKGIANKEIATKFKISPETVYDIVKKLTWKNV